MFQDFMKTPVVLYSRKETKDEWGHYEYEDGVNLLCKFQKTDQWAISPTATEMVRKARVYLSPDTQIYAGDKLVIDEEEYIVDDVSIVRNKDGTTHHLEADL